MRNTRKGFTLVELLLVIGIIAILGAMGLVGGREATSIAEAQKIVENFHLISSAMNMYYADNTSAIAKDTAFTAAKIRTGIKPYIKDISVVEGGESATAGKFFISLGTTNNTEWWLQYTLGAADAKIADILANKAVQEGFKKSDSEGTEEAPNSYEATTTTTGDSGSTTTFNKDIFLRVR